MTKGTPVWKWHTGSPTSLSDVGQPNQILELASSQLAAVTMWVAAILHHLKLGLGGYWGATFSGNIVETLIIPDLTQGKAVNNKKNLWVEDNKATLEEEAEINGEMYAFCTILSQLITICHLRF